MTMTIVRGVIAGLIVIGVTELSHKSPRAGALLLTLPLVSILAFVMTWSKDHDLPAITRLARETLVLVPLGLPFFIPLAFATRWGLGFWTALGMGSLLATIAIASWLTLAQHDS